MNTITIQENDRDRRSKYCKINVGSKTISSPNYGLRIKNIDELNTYTKIRKSISIPYAQICVFKYYDAPKTINQYLGGNLSKFLYPGMIIPDTPIQELLKQVPIIIDPATDGLYYQSEVENFDGKGLKLNPSLRKYIMDFQKQILIYNQKAINGSQLNKWRDIHHNKFWQRLNNDDVERIKFIEDMLKEQLRFGADIPIAPTPLITSKAYLKMAININDKSKEVSKSINEQCATSFYLSSNMLADESIFDEIASYLTNDDTKTPLTVFKFKNLNLTINNKIAERATYRKLMLDLDDITQVFKNKVFMVLENNIQLFVSSLVGFHIVSCALDGWDMSSGGKAGGPFGSWYDPEAMVFRSYEKDIRNVFDQLGRLPDDCIICNKYKTKPTNSDMWNLDRKMHHMIKRNDENSMVIDSIDKKDILHAVDKLGRSQISILRNTLPY